MAGDTVARSVNKFIYIRVGGQIRWIYPPLNKPKSLCAIGAAEMIKSVFTKEDFIFQLSFLKVRR